MPRPPARNGAGARTSRHPLWSSQRSWLPACRSRAWAVGLELTPSGFGDRRATRCTTPIWGCVPRCETCAVALPGCETPPYPGPGGWRALWVRATCATEPGCGSTRSPPGPRVARTWARPRNRTAWAAAVARSNATTSRVGVPRGAGRHRGVGWRPAGCDETVRPRRP